MKEKRRQAIVPIDYYSEGELENVSDGSLVEEEVERKVVRAQVEKLIDSLPEKLRIPMIMFYNADVPFKDIAKTLRIPEGTVKSRLHKARIIIKEGLEVEGYGKV
jgi:RNA polymerase sigma-70 factor, ECF subfamily